MTPVELSRTVLRAVRRAVDVGELRVSVPERVVVAPPGAGGCGDYATNIALQLARPAGMPPQRVAEVLREQLLALRRPDGIDDVVVTGPGFLNIRLRDAGGASAALVEEILRCGARYGYAAQPSGQVVQLHCPCEVRAVVVADTVARLLRAQGTLVRTSCERPPPPEWEHVLGARPDVSGSGTDGVPAPLDVNVRPVPVPAPADLLRLGRDAARWALLHPAGHDRVRVTDELLVQRESNPLFRVRYAHARTRALGRNATDLGFARAPGPVTGTEPLVTTLVTALADHPRVLAAAAAHRAPDRLARQLVTIADALLAFQHTVLPRGEEKPSAAHRARLALAEAAGTVLAGGLSLLGIDAPDHL
ncbi:DALR anticodon-binding domain-containing protein [Streptomyces sp. Li-HN-5-11]|uniref:ArgS-related anticodon-binding protein NrtL n=1 Tax=Streptomyces sp. Li-HN-5-11 TaxID=3075432 RepID=UPI0028A7B547|nr:DALR anticodon-binding domain-containing protein [Streptomyces sp. Li-HN-5-11]WNM30268.1 DALR anticodon-binding domain-containing protein [Streptomyces sp. Li-HN-5-11]